MFIAGALKRSQVHLTSGTSRAPAPLCHKFFRKFDLSFVSHQRFGFADRKKVRKSLSSRAHDLYKFLEVNPASYNRHH